MAGPAPVRPRSTFGYPFPESLRNTSASRSSVWVATCCPGFGPVSRSAVDGEEQRGVLGNAEARHEGHLSAFDLTLAPCTAELPYRFDDVVRGHGVRLGKQASMGVDRTSAAEVEPIVANELRPFALRGEPEILELEQHRDGEAVIDLGDIDIAQREAGVCEGPWTGYRRWSGGDVFALPEVLGLRHGFGSDAHARYCNRRTAEVSRSLDTRHHVRNRPVIHQTTIQ